MWISQANNTMAKRSYPHEILDMNRSSSSESKVLLLSKDLVRELDVETFETLRKWKFYFKERSPSKAYRFLDSEDAAEKIVVTNGWEIAFVSKPKNTKSKKEISDFSPPIYVQLPTWLGYQEFETISQLKPNNSMARKFALSDFKQVLERIVWELTQKLQQQINITQLSIPESDLFDEYLIPDFVAIMEELEQQTILSKDELNLKFKEISLPETPAQVLGAHVLQIVWPAIEEIEEIHSYLKENETHNHPLCKNITKSLASLIQEVMEQANIKPENEHSKELFKIIAIVRKYDKILKDYTATLHDKQRVMENLDQEDPIQISATNNYGRMFPLNYVANAAERFEPREEILSLKVGSVTKPRRLIAVRRTLTIGLEASIHLYDAEFKGTPLQIIKAQNPRSLIELRLKQETLLMFVENCCQVQVWRYEGLQGFTKFTSLDNNSEVQQILTISLPDKEGTIKYYLVLVTAEQIKFYEIVLLGITQAPPALPCN